MSEFSQSDVTPLAKSLRNIRFPISRTTLLRKHGDTPIQLENDKILTLEQAISHVWQPEFMSISDLMLAIGELNKTANPKVYP